jgi:hypothetical protein
MAHVISTPPHDSAMPDKTWLATRRLLRLPCLQRQQPTIRNPRNFVPSHPHVFQRGSGYAFGSQGSRPGGPSRNPERGASEHLRLTDCFLNSMKVPTVNEVMSFNSPVQTTSGSPSLAAASERPDALAHGYPAGPWDVGRIPAPGESTRQENRGSGPLRPR